MGLLPEAPRGGLVEVLAGAPRVLVLRNAEIERFEDMHRGIFEAWDAFIGLSLQVRRPSAKEVRTLVGLGLVGGGLSNSEANGIMAGLGPDANPILYKIAQALIGVAFWPEVAEDDDPAGDLGDPAARDAKKKA